MSDTITLRDHSEPCKHSQEEDRSGLGYLGAYFVEEEQLWECVVEGCPGGREVTFDIERIKRALVGMALGDHMGDVNRYLPDITEALSLPAPTWSDQWNRYVMAWEVTDE